MASSKYTAMRDRAQLEAYVSNTPNFMKTVRFEPHEEREGYLLITDGSFSFGMMPEESVNRVLNDETQVDDLDSKPEILKHISCFDLNRNAKAYEREASKTTIDRFEEKVSFFAPNKKMLIWLVIVVVIAIAAPIASMKIFSKSTSGYSKEFYSSKTINKKLLNFRDNWVRVVETKETADPKLADYLCGEILKFSKEVDLSQLDAEQKEALDHLVNQATAYRKNN